MLRALQEVHQLPNFDPIKHRVRCFAHTLNLAIQAFLFAEDPEAAEEAIRQWNSVAKSESHSQAP